MLLAGALTGTTAVLLLLLQCYGAGWRLEHGLNGKLMQHQQQAGGAAVMQHKHQRQCSTSSSSIGSNAAAVAALAVPAEAHQDLLAAAG